MLLPRHCAVCREVGSSLCERCAALLSPAPEPEHLLGLDRCVALFAYEGAGRTVIGRLKYANHRDSLGPLAKMLAAAVDSRADLVTWVPTSPSRRRERGYDQAELIARAVARSLSVRARPTVRRLDRGPQMGKQRSERLETRFSPLRPLRSGVVVVVDDVRTTGASLGGVAAALRSAGVEWVIGATLAATPSRGAESTRRSEPETD